MSAVFVTGGSGFIGSLVIQRLVGDGHTVRALARSEQAAARISERGGEPVRGDLSDIDAMRSGAVGCELAFHTAAIVEDWGKRDDVERGLNRQVRASVRPNTRPDCDYDEPKRARQSLLAR